MAAQGSPRQGDECFVTDLFRNAESILSTALSSDSTDLESRALAILVSDDGAIRMLMGTDWPVDSLQSHYCATVYRVSRSGGQVRVEGKSRTGSCVLESVSMASVAKRMLENRPRYLLNT